MTETGIERDSNCGFSEEYATLHPGKTKDELLLLCGVDLSQIADESCRITSCDPLAQEFREAASCKRIDVVCGEGCADGINARAESIKRRTLCNPAQDLRKILGESSKKILCASLIEDWKQSVASRSETTTCRKRCADFEREKAEIVEKLAQFYPDHELRKAMAEVEIERKVAAMKNEMNWFDIEEENNNSITEDMEDDFDDASRIEASSFGHSELEYAFDFLERARSGESLLSQIDADDNSNWSEYIAIPRISDKSLWLAEFQRLNATEGIYSVDSTEESSVVSEDETRPPGPRMSLSERTDSRKLRLAVSAGQLAADSEDDSVVRSETPAMEDLSIDEVELEMFLPAEMTMPEVAGRMSVIHEEPFLEEPSDEFTSGNLDESVPAFLDSLPIQQRDPSTSFDKRVALDARS